MLVMTGRSWLTWLYRTRARGEHRGGKEGGNEKRQKRKTYHPKLIRISKNTVCKRIKLNLFIVNYL